MSPLSQLVEPSLIFPDLGSRGGGEILSFFADQIADHHRLDSADLLSALEERESLGSTGIGGAIAIPHCRSPHLKQATIAVGLAPQGVEFGAIDGAPVRLFFVIVSAARDPRQNLRCLAAISAWAKQEGAVESVLTNPTREGIVDALASLPDV